MVNKILGAFSSGLFPGYCTLCGLRSYRSLPLCHDCEQELQDNGRCCYRCAVPLPDATPYVGATLCGRCLQTPPPYDRVRAPWLYCERMAYLIRRWKFHGETRLTPLLAALWLQRASELNPVDLLVPVPLHWQRLWQRGFNQSEILCRQLLAQTPGLTAAGLEHRTVRRSRPTPAQSGMGARRRAANLRGAFTAHKRYDNLRIAIVDDVFTTGATATALALTLRAAGASSIEVWCLARTPAPGS